MTRIESLGLSSTVLRACEILRAFGANQELLRLRDVVARTGLNKSTALRLLHSLQQGGLIEQAVNGQYRTKIRQIEGRKHRIGYAGHTVQSAFCREVTASLTIAAELEGIDLIVFDNSGNERISLRNAEKLIEAKIDLAIEYQPSEQIAPLIAAKFREAGIPLIAISFAHPGAVYYGPNNYAVGVLAGRALGHWAKHQPKPFQEVLLLGLPASGPITQARIKGTEAGLFETFSAAAQTRVVHLDGNGDFSQSFDVVRKFYRHNTSDRMLVGAINDESALGALAALHQLGRVEGCGFVSQGGSVEGRAELRKPGTRLIGSVAFFPEKYGHDLLALASKILQKRPMPTSLFLNHILLTSKNVDLYYIQDLVSPQ